MGNARRIPPAAPRGARQAAPTSAWDDEDSALEAASLGRSSRLLSAHTGQPEVTDFERACSMIEKGLSHQVELLVRLGERLDLVLDTGGPERTPGASTAYDKECVTKIGQAMEAQANIIADNNKHLGELITRIKI